MYVSIVLSNVSVGIPEKIAYGAHHVTPVCMVAASLSDICLSFILN